MIPIPVSPLMRAFAVVGSERTAIDSMMRLYGLTKAEARLVVRTMRADTTNQPQPQCETQPDNDLTGMT